MDFSNTDFGSKQRHSPPPSSPAQNPQAPQNGTNQKSIFDTPAGIPLTSFSQNASQNTGLLAIMNGPHKILIWTVAIVAIFIFLVWFVNTYGGKKTENDYGEYSDEDDYSSEDSDDYLSSLSLSVSPEKSKQKPKTKTAAL